MISKRAVLIPIAEIRIVNPRSRNRITFHAIKANIALVGLKKPITAFKRGLADDGTQYDLTCGQGRLEAMRDLGETMIHAILKDAPPATRYTMSLVENLARRQPQNTALLHELKRLLAQHYKPTTIAEKLGLDKSYIYGAINLLRRGEEKLIANVEAGRLPIETAIQIATGTDAEVQRALNDAYENGTLRGAKLRIVQQIINRRLAMNNPKAGKPQLTGEDLVREYERYTHQQRLLVRRSAIVTERLAVLAASMRRLLSDDHFLTVLQAEGLHSIPVYLSERIKAAL
jgi:ParB family chromosome partitioning protein